MAPWNEPNKMMKMMMMSLVDSHMTLSEALVLARPAGLAAVHVYWPACRAAARLIFKEHAPPIADTA